MISAAHGLRHRGVELSRSTTVFVGVFAGDQLAQSWRWFIQPDATCPTTRLYINKLDRLGADFVDSYRQMKLLSVVPAICVIPVGQSGDFEGVIDLVKMKFIQRDASATNAWRCAGHPQGHARWSAEVPGGVAGSGGAYADDYRLVRAGRARSPISRGRRRKGTLDGKFTPIFCGSSKNFHGVQPCRWHVDFFASAAGLIFVRWLGAAVFKTMKAASLPPRRSSCSRGWFKTVAESTATWCTCASTRELEPGGTYLNTTYGKTEPHRPPIRRQDL